MAVASAASFTAARAGMLGGAAADELVLLRYLVASLVFLPFLVRWGLLSLVGIGWARGLVLLLCGGPLFAWLQFAAYSYAPLAHGAIILPPTVTILSTVAAALFLKEHLGTHHLAGTALVIGGIALLGWDGIVNVTTPQAWVGDLMFLAAAVLWACFTVLMRHWRLSAVRAVAVVSLLSSVSLLPTYLMSGELRVILNAPWSVLATQGIVQGLLQGLIGVAAYTRAIRVLGVSRAVLFPATIPALAVLLGIPAIGETPSAIQIVGLAGVTTGVLIAIGGLRILRRWTFGATPVRRSPRPAMASDAASHSAAGRAAVSDLLPAPEARFDRRTALTFPPLPSPQKNRSPPSDSSPDTPAPGGISSLSRHSPVNGSIRRKSLSSLSQVPCHNSPSTQVTPVTKRLDSMVRSTAPVCGST